jgi:hypothetical protein
MLFAGLGEGMEPALQGLITYLTNSSANTQLFTVLALVDTIAGITGGPLTASLMAIGRSEQPKHASDGWCFFASSVCYRLTFHCLLSQVLQSPCAEQKVLTMADIFRPFKIMFTFLAIWSIRVSAHPPQKVKPELEEDVNEDEH